MGNIHYEIFRLRGKGSSWTLFEAMEQREAAIERAKALMKDGEATAVRVVKETFQSSTGDYLSLKVFEEGETEVKKKNKKTEDLPPTLPCFKPDDLYNYHARMTMARIFGEWLSRQKLTVIELIHNAKSLEKFEATGTTYQHSLQKVAVAQAADSDVPVGQIVKQLNELCMAAIHRVYKDEKKGLFKEVKSGEFKALAASLADHPAGRYLLNGSIAKYLTAAKGWDEKLRLLLGLMDELAAEGSARALLLTSIDALVAEMLNGSAALADLLGQNPDLGHALLNLVALFLGTEIPAADGGARGINDLARSFAKDDLPEARAAIATRILAELRGLKRLCPSSLEQEFKMLRRLANQLVRGQGKYMSHEDLISAFTERSQRLVGHETISQFLADAKTPDEKIERLLLVEENIIGAENKRKLSTFIMPILSSNSFEAQLYPMAQPAQRLRRAAELQERVRRSGFQDIQKSQIAVALDGVAQTIESRSKFLASLEMRVANPLERAHTLVKLCKSGTFTQGDLMMKVRRLLGASLAKPGFAAFYIAQLEQAGPGGVDREAALKELVSLLTSVGMGHEEAQRALAA